MAKFKMEVDGKTLRAAKDLAEELGLDLESVTRAFFRQMVRDNGIPLTLSLAAPVQAEAAGEEKPAPALAPKPEKKVEPKAEKKAAPKPEKKPAPAPKPAPKPAAEPATVPELSSIPSQDELLERMLELREEAQKEAEAKEAVERDKKRKEELAGKLSATADKVIAERKAAEAAKAQAAPAAKPEPEEKKLEEKKRTWRDSWLFEDDDPDDQLLFSPFEF